MSRRSKVVQLSRSGSRRTAPASPVCLVSMPFGVLTPSLGLSLLKSALAQREVAADVRYFTLDFARRFGYLLYERLACRVASGVGEAVFRGALWPGDKTPPPEVLDDVELCGDLDFGSLQAAATDFVDTCAASIDWRAYRVVGFTSTFAQMAASLALAQRVKDAAPDALIVVGGANCEGEMGAAYLRNFDCIDYVFSGEADDAFPEFVTQVLAGREPSQIPGVAGRGGSVATGAAAFRRAAVPVDLERLPYPDMDDFFSQLGDLAGRIPLKLPFETSRGCWWGQKHHCTFCGLNGSAMAFRSKSPERAFAEIRYLHDRYADRAKYMCAVDNILDTKYFTTLLPRLQELDREVRFFFEVKSNMTRTQISALAGANVHYIQPGIESLSSEVLKLMRKGCTRLQNLQTLKWCAEYGLDPGWNFLFGFPGEAASEYRDIETLLPAIEHLRPPGSVGRIRLDRFSPYFDHADRYGITNVVPHPVYSYLYGLPEKELRALAYFFLFEYEDGRDLGYADGFVAAVQRWIDTRERGCLLGFPAGDSLLVLDERAIATQRWTVLEGLYADAIAVCDCARSVSTMMRELDRRARPAVEDSLRAAVEELCRQRFLVEETGRYLSLIVMTRGERAPSVPREKVVRLRDESRTNGGTNHEKVTYA